MPQFKRISVVGVGLLGGSLGLAAKERDICEEVVGVRRYQASIDEAKRLGAIDEGYTSIAEGVRGADLIVLCSPVRQIVEIMPEVFAHAAPGAIVTDVGSTKLSIVTAGEAAAAGTGSFFVGSHPMAGSEKSGVRFATPKLYEDSTCFVTKTAATDLRVFSQVCTLWESLGCRIVMARPDRHDQLVALISHLPHLASVALVSAVDSFKEDQNLVKGIVGNGFRDMTRLAGGSTELWQDICGENKQNILEVCRRFEKVLADLVETAESDDGQLTNLLESARRYREYIKNR